MSLAKLSTFNSAVSIVAGAALLFILGIAPHVIDGSSNAFASGLMLCLLGVAIGRILSLAVDGNHEAGQLSRAERDRLEDIDKEISALRSDISSLRARVDA